MRVEDHAEPGAEQLLVVRQARRGRLRFRVLAPQPLAGPDKSPAADENGAPSACALSDGSCKHLRILIRRDDPTDHAAVRTIVGEAFKDQALPGEPPVEIGLIDALRVSPEWIPQLSLIAESDEQTVVGYVICTRGWVDGRPALGLGPLAVAPAAQRRGAGSALMHAVLGAADALEEPLVALLGHTEYYPRFGFRPADQLGIVPPVAAWAPHFQVRTLTSYQPALRGTFRYAQPFDDL